MTCMLWAEAIWAKAVSARNIKIRMVSSPLDSFLQVIRLMPGLVLIKNYFVEYLNDDQRDLVTLYSQKKAAGTFVPILLKHDKLVTMHFTDIVVACTLVEVPGGMK